MKRASALCVVFLASLLTDAALGQCVSYHYTASSAAFIGVSAGSGWGSAPPIGAAIAIWDNCAGMGVDFPALGQGQGGDVNVDVEFRPNTSNPLPEVDALRSSMSSMGRIMSSVERSSSMDEITRTRRVDRTSTTISID